MKLRINGAAGAFEAVLTTHDGKPALSIRWPEGDGVGEVVALADVANERCEVIWATTAERVALSKAGFKMEGQW